MVFLILFILLLASFGTKGEQCAEKNISIETIVYKNNIAFEVTWENPSLRRICFHHSNAPNSTCPDHDQNREECRNVTEQSVILERGVVWNGKPQPLMGCPFNFWIIQDESHDTVECTYNASLEAMNHDGGPNWIKNHTAYPKPKISLNGTILTWNIGELDGPNLTLHIYKEGEWSKQVHLPNTTIQLERDQYSFKAFIIDQHQRFGLTEEFNFSVELLHPVEEANHVKWQPWVLAIVALALVFLTVQLTWWLLRRRRLRQLDEHRDWPQGMTERENPLYFLKSMMKTVNSEIYPQIVPKELKHVRRLGEGNFGQVDLMQWESSLVAVKTFKGLERIEIETGAGGQSLNEIQIFKKVGCHKNIVQMLGYNSALEPHFIVLEYVEKGDLLSYLHKLRTEYEKMRKLESIEDHQTNYLTAEEVESRPLQAWPTVASPIRAKDLESFGRQIAAGMAHLEKCEIVHRDLAARNILLKDDLTVKITDFGLSRVGLYLNVSKSKLPLRWMAPETFNEKNAIFCSKSDVWSFGIVLWEIGSLGAQPYEDLSPTQLIMKLAEGERLSRPETITDNLYDLMQRCWIYNYQERPSFYEIVDEFKRMNEYFEFSSLNADYHFPPIYKNINY